MINDKQGSLWCGHLTPVDHRKILYDHVGLIVTFPVAVFFGFLVARGFLLEAVPRRGWVGAGLVGVGWVFLVVVMVCGVNKH